MDAAGKAAGTAAPGQGAVQPVAGPYRTARAGTVHASGAHGGADCPAAACDQLGRAETAAYGEAAGSVDAPDQNSGSPAAAVVVTRIC